MPQPEPEEGWEYIDPEKPELGVYSVKQGIYSEEPQKARSPFWSIISLLVGTQIFSWATALFGIILYCWTIFISVNIFGFLLGLFLGAIPIVGQVSVIFGVHSKLNSWPTYYILAVTIFLVFFFLKWGMLFWFAKKTGQL